MIVLRSALPAAISCYPGDRQRRKFWRRGFSDVDDGTASDRLIHLRGERRSRLALHDRSRRILHHAERGEAPAVLQMRPLHPRPVRRALSGALPGDRDRGSRRPRLRPEHLLLGWAQSWNLPQELSGEPDWSLILLIFLFSFPDSIWHEDCCFLDQ